MLGEDLKNLVSTSLDMIKFTAIKKAKRRVQKEYYLQFPGVSNQTRWYKTKMRELLSMDGQQKRSNTFNQRTSAKNICFICSPTPLLC